MSAEIEIAKHIGDNLRHHREQADVSQEELAFAPDCIARQSASWSEASGSRGPTPS